MLNTTMPAIAASTRLALLRVKRALIRPLLEGDLRMKQPKEVAPNEWLGDTIKKIRDAQSGSQLHDAQPLLGEAIVKKTLEFVGGF